MMRQTVQMQKAVYKGLHWPNVEREVQVSYGSMLLEGSFPDGASGKESACSAEDTRGVGSIPGSERSPGVGNDNPLQYSCLENPMDRGAW